MCFILRNLFQVIYTLMAWTLCRRFTMSVPFVTVTLSVGKFWTCLYKVKMRLVQSCDQVERKTHIKKSLISLELEPWLWLSIHVITLGLDIITAKLSRRQRFRAINVTTPGNEETAGPRYISRTIRYLWDVGLQITYGLEPICAWCIVHGMIKNQHQIRNVTPMD